MLKWKNNWYRLLPKKIVIDKKEYNLQKWVVEGGVVLQYIDTKDPSHRLQRYACSSSDNTPNNISGAALYIYHNLVRDGLIKKPPKSYFDEESKYEVVEK